MTIARPSFGSFDAHTEGQERTHRVRTRRNILITLRVTAREAEVLAAEAERLNLTPSQLMRARLFATSPLEPEQMMRRLAALLERMEAPSDRVLGSEGQS